MFTAEEMYTAAAFTMFSETLLYSPKVQQDLNNSYLNQSYILY